MSLITIKALILRANQALGQDRYLRLLSADEGLSEVFARAALNPKSPLLATTEAFGLCEFNLFTNKEKYYVNQASFVYPFAKLKSSIEALTAAAHLSDLAIDTAQSAEQARPLYQLMVYAFYALEKAAEEEVSSVLAVTHAAEIRLLAQAGYRLNFSQCPHCGIDLEQESELFFSFPDMSFLCAEEGRKRLRNGREIVLPAWQTAATAYLGQPIWPLSRALYDALHYFTESELGRLFSFRYPPRLERELAAFSQAYLTASLEKHYRRLDFLYQLNEQVAFR